MKIAFIGLGLMGRLMSARLADAGYALKTFDKNGSGTHQSARSAVEGADILITMLPDGRVVRRVVRAALPSVRRGTLVVDMSSSDPADTCALGAELRRQGVSLIDAPEFRQTNGLHRPKIRTNPKNEANPLSSASRSRRRNHS